MPVRAACVLFQAAASATHITLTPPARASTTSVLFSAAPCARAPSGGPSRPATLPGTSLSVHDRIMLSDKTSYLTSFGEVDGKRVEVLWRRTLPLDCLVRTSGPRQLDAHSRGSARRAYPCNVLKSSSQIAT